MEGLVLHENHVSDFESPHKVLDGWSEVTSSSPHVLNESDFIRVNIEGFGQPSIVEFNDLIFEEYIFFWGVKNLDTHHDESGIMTSSNTNVV